MNDPKSENTESFINGVNQGHSSDEDDDEEESLDD